MKTFGKGLLTGSLIGATLALLYAPKTGKQSRQDLLTGLDDGAKQVNELQSSLTHFNQSLANFKQEATRTLPLVSTEMKETLEAFKFQTEPRTKEIKQTLDSLSEHVNDYKKKLP